MLIAVIPFLSNGCGGSRMPSDLPLLEPCTITLKQEGVPLADAMVFLRSIDTTFIWTVGGKTDANGVTIPKTHAQFPGVPVGEYKLVINKTERFQKKPNEQVPGGDVTETIQGSPVILYTFVEKQYTDIGTTPLLIKIKKGTNHLEFDVGKAIREQLETINL
jgi:hypothetical protein